MMSMHSLWPRDRESMKDAKIDRDSARRVWRFARPYRGMVVGFLVTVIAQALLGLVPPLLFGRIIDDAIPDENTGLLAWFAFFIVLAALASAAVSLFERYWSSLIGEGVIFDLRTQLFDHVQRLPLAFFTRTQTGTLTNRLNSDVIGAQRALTATLGTVVSNVIVLVTTVFAMFVIEWRLTMLALIITPLFVAPYRKIGQMQQNLTRQSMDHNAQMNSTMTERFNVSGALLVKLFGRQNDEAEMFSERAAAVRDIGIKSALFTRSFMIMLSLLGAIGTALVYGLGGYFAIQKSIDPGDLVTMGLLIGRVYTPLTGLTNARIDVLTALVSFDRVFEVLDAPSPLTDKPGALELPRPSGEIQFNDVTFRYPDSTETIIPSLETQSSTLSDEDSPPVIRNLSVTIQPGQLVALVGPSGAGKTTITNLVPRLYDVTGGALLIDGHDVRDVTQDSLRAAIGVVVQDPHLFHESIRDNLLYAKPNATREDLERVCRAAQIWDTIEKLPGGLDTVVGDRGYRMSGGEKQRLSIARMLLKDPAIVILDEATSSLDSENESLVQQALAEALRGRTALVIAHRLSTITDADLILVLDQGHLVDKGTHTELMANVGLYSELYTTLVRGDLEPTL
ncbi:MAG: ABC transporter ATP-binding protein [Acidimicrobiales bacterium]|nr:ABC transporter ATP-binding protein [Acidimicrobiales bacterium]